MGLARTHRRLAILMCLASLLAFVGGAGLEPLPAILAAGGLMLGLFWQPSTALSSRLEKAWLFFAILLATRALFHVFLIQDDVVIPVVDLLFLLLAAEALRSLDASNDARLYSLSFALLLASTAYRPGLLFLIAFLAYVGLATVTLIYGHLRRQAERHGIAQIEVPASFLVTVTAMTAVTLTVAILVFLTFPRVSRGWAGRGETLATSIAGFADEVSLGSHGSRIFGNPQIVLRVEFPATPPSDPGSLYWRGRSYDRFDGVRWSKSSRQPPSQGPQAWYHRWGTELMEQKIYAAPLNSRVLFALHPLLDVQAEARIQPITDNAGDHLYWGSGSPAYSAYSLTSRPSPAQLRAAQGRFTPAGEYYTQLPALPPEVLSLADSLLAEAATDYDRAINLVQWFQEEFAYSLELPRTAREATLENFLLRRKEGHCEYFSTAMAILLRTQGIPTREVNGFLGGTWSNIGDYLAVTQNQAHAWVEVWFPEYGWVPFDPTPAGVGGGSASTSRFWPGRFMLDAIQHQWNKWVLDYSFQTQFSLLEWSREALSEKTHGASPESVGKGVTLPLERVWLGLGILLFALGGLWSLRRHPGTPAESRAFIRLREASRRSGVPDFALHSPHSLTDYLDSKGHPATVAAQRVVDGYIHARFSGIPAREDQEEEMWEALNMARRFLRKSPVRGWTSSQSD